MNAFVFSLKNFEEPFLFAANNNKHQLKYTSKALTLDTVELAKGNDAVFVFANDDVSAPVVQKLNQLGIKLIAIRAVGYDNVDIAEANRLGIMVTNVPEYSPYSVAEHTIVMIMALNRKIILSNKQVHQNNFSLDNLIGFDLKGKTVGIIGTGRIGTIVAKILNGFGCRILAHDINPNQLFCTKYGLTYVDMDTLCKESDIITIHTNLSPSTKYLINKTNIALMKKAVMLINVSRGAIINTSDVIEALNSGKIGYLGMDVYEKEKGLFFYDHSEKILQDEMLTQLLKMGNVLITGHQAFLTETALKNIAETTIHNLDCFEQNVKNKNELTSHLVVH